MKEKTTIKNNRHSEEHRDEESFRNTGCKSTLHKHKKILPLRQAQCQNDGAENNNDRIGDVKLKEQIGFNLFKTRAKADIPLDFVAKLTKIKIGKLDSLERGHGCMNVANLEILANFYDINIGDLFR